MEHTSSEALNTLRQAVDRYYRHLNGVAPLYSALRQAARQAHDAGVPPVMIAEIARVAQDEVRGWLRR